MGKTVGLKLGLKAWDRGGISWRAQVTRENHKCLQQGKLLGDRVR